ncbi:MAG: helix-turn-helix transcriptional regulator [Ruminococcus flavefaciens]|nr:helix-turn-helix transcriptional regulator [Ruminococcus flavefaciens]MCM1060458.1 helix-turn-helix transcriptional regulator [Eubacterium sp.]
MAKCPNSYYCPVEATIDLIGGKYKAVILWHLTDGTKRFSEFKRLMPEITEKMLAQQLRDLESDGLITRTVYPVVPPKVEYNLSEFGLTIVPVLQAMCDWGRGYIERKLGESSR